MLSLWLANVYLHRLTSRFRTSTCGCGIRYADAAVLMARTASEAQKALERAKEVIEGELGLSVHPKKKRLVTVYQGMPFLGFELRRSRDGKIAAWIKEKALEQFKERVRELPALMPAY